MNEKIYAQGELERYLPEELAHNLFTLNKLKQMDLVPTRDHVAYVMYPEQKRNSNFL